MIDKRFGKLVVIESTTLRTKSRSKIWMCRCDCGNFHKVSTSDLNRLNGGVKSCGCLRLERLREKGIWNRLGIRLANINALYASYKKSAKTRNLKFTIDKNLFSSIILKKCYYCNTKPSQVMNKQNTNGKLIYNGIDRINNKLGYIKDNIVPCCKTCNYAKRQMSEKDFTNWIKIVYTNIQKRGNNG